MVRIQVFGSGCAPCKAMLQNVQTAVAELELDTPVEHMTRVLDLIQAGITATPTFMVDGHVHSAGKVLDVATIKGILTNR